METNIYGEKLIPIRPKLVDGVQVFDVEPKSIPKYQLNCIIVNSGYNSIIIKSATTKKTSGKYERLGVLNGKDFKRFPKSIQPAGRLEILIARDEEIFEVEQISFLDSNGNPYDVDPEKIEQALTELREKKKSN